MLTHKFFDYSLSIRDDDHTRYSFLYVKYYEEVTVSLVIPSRIS